MKRKIYEFLAADRKGKKIRVLATGWEEGKYRFWWRDGKEGNWKV